MLGAWLTRSFFPFFSLSLSLSLYLSFSLSLPLSLSLPPQNVKYAEGSWRGRKLHRSRAEMLGGGDQFIFLFPSISDFPYNSPLHLLLLPLLLLHLIPHVRAEVGEEEKGGTGGKWLMKIQSHLSLILLLSLCISLLNLSKILSLFSLSFSEGCIRVGKFILGINCL